MRGWPKRGGRRLSACICFEQGPIDMRTLCLWLIRGYRMVISPLYGRTCRFEPSCSQYASDAITKYGALQGFGLTILRLLKCHPFHPGGEDPVK
ncbi:MAG: membrane protein insertion efficiency factor YidD [Nitrospira sp.]